MENGKITIIIVRESICLKGKIMRCEVPTSEAGVKIFVQICMIINWNIKIKKIKVKKALEFIKLIPCLTANR